MTSAHEAWKEYIESAISYIPLPIGTGHPDEDATLFIGLRTVVTNLARQHPGFPLPFPKTNIPQSFIIRETPTMGLGMFSKRAFQPGDIIVRERPLMVCLDSLNLLRQHPSHHGLPVLTLLGQILLRGRATHMSAANKDAFMALSTDFDLQDGMSLAGKEVFPDLYILAANAFNVFGEQDGMQYRAVTKYASRINHSCSPNAVWQFDKATFTFIVTAVRKIAPDEQILIPYCSLDIPRSHRQIFLSPYGIMQCSCSSCTTGGSESDERRQNIARATQDGYKLLVNAIQSKSCEAGLEFFLRIHQDISKEGLQCEGVYPIALDATGRYYQRLRRPRLAKPMIRDAAIQYSLRGLIGEGLRVFAEPFMNRI